MSGKFREWAENLGADVKRDIAEKLREESSYARDDIRQKIVEEGWTGSVQTPSLNKTSETDASPEPAPEEGVDIQGNTTEGADFSDTVWEQEKAAALETAEMETRSENIAWDVHKAKAEELYGHSPTDGGTVWDNEQNTDIKAPEIEAPDIEEPEIDGPDIEPE